MSGPSRGEKCGLGIKLIGCISTFFASNLILDLGKYLRRDMKKAYFVIPLLLLISCTTMEDFHAMSPDERADSVCSATSAYRQRKQTLADLNREIAERENLLATGYRVYETCQIVSISVPGKTADCEGLTGKELKGCRKGNAAATTENRRICTQTPVPIDYNYEGSILRDLKMTRENQLEIHDLQTDSCLSKASSLPAEEAYLRYKGNMEP